MENQAPVTISELTEQIHGLTSQAGGLYKVVYQEALKIKAENDALKEEIKQLKEAKQE